MTTLPPDVLARHEHLLVDDFQTLINVNSAIVGGERVDYDIDVIIPANDDAIRAVKLITAKLADAIIEGRQGEDAAAVEAEFAASEAQADSIEEIVEVVEGDNA